MDYRELIKRLRASNRDSLVSSEEVATAIETLMAERDVAVAELDRIAKWEKKHETD